MTITIYSIINGVLWSCLMAIPLFFLSRSSKVICYCGTMPLFVIAIGCIFRSVFIVEFRSAQEIGIPVMLNPVNSFMIQAANGVSLETWFSRIWAIGSVIAACFWLFAYVVRHMVCLIPQMNVLRSSVRSIMLPICGFPSRKRLKRPAWWGSSMKRSFCRNSFTRNGSSM